VDPNEYLKKVYEMVVTGWGRHRIRNENAYVLVLEPGRKHDGEGLGLKFECRFAHAKIEHACPPNQSFKASDFVQVPAPVAATESDKESSSDELESSDDEVEEANDDPYDRPVWERKSDESLKFRDEMPTCWRKLAEPSSLEHPPSLIHTTDPSVHEAEWYADYFFSGENRILFRCRFHFLGDANFINGAAKPERPPKIQDNSQDRPKKKPK
jgi:hypothetical protein